VRGIRLGPMLAAGWLLVSSAAMADEYANLRLAMVEAQIEARGISDARVLAAMRRVPRHEFVPEELRASAYEDRPLPIGHAQTISQPYIVAAMTELARIQPGSVVLEVGTGSGYGAAVIHEVAKQFPHFLTHRGFGGLESFQ